MTTTEMSEVIQHIRQAVLLRDGAGMTDGQLLEGFISRRDVAAFAVLVRRHGPMVWGVCRRVLHNHQDAEDAFQATFLVLVRKAASVVPRGMVANWLYGVAHKTALKARATADRRKMRERQVAEMPEPAVQDQELRRDLQALLDQELSRLPDKYRVAIVLCDLEGWTRKEAARQLGVPEGTLSGRLTRGRTMLAKRMSRHGLVLSGGALAALLGQSVASAGVPPLVLASTIKAASLYAAGQAAAGLISVKVAALTEGVLKAMLLTKLKVAIAVAVLVIVGSLGVGAFTHTTAVPGQPDAPRNGQPAPKPRAESAPPLAKQDQTAKDSQKITVSGRVLDPKGKPVRAARVFVLDRPARVIRSLEDFCLELAGDTETDAQGRFELRARAPGGEPPPSPIHPLPVILVRAQGYGVGVHAVTNNAKKEPIVIRLPREQVLRARFVDERGKPVKDLVVKVASVTHGVPGQGGGMVIPPAQAPQAWFTAMKTDAQGRFQLRGIGPGQYVFVEWHDSRFQSQRLDLWRTEAQLGGEEVVHKLIPPVPQFISGRVTFKDTGKPAAGVIVRTRGSKTKTDVEGRFRLKPDWEVSTTLEDVTIVGGWVEADAPAGTAYLGWQGRPDLGRVPHRDGTLGPWELMEFKIALPRGVLVWGRVLEAGTNKGIPGANISFIPDAREARADVSSGPDGAFSLTAVPGPGRLIVAAARADYVPVDVGSYGQFAHAVVRVGFKKGTEAKAVQIPLRRGVVVKGKLTGPDGQPVKGAVLISRLTTCAATLWWGEIHGLPVSPDFELRGCDREKPYPVIFFQEQKGWGALVHVSGKQAGKPLDVRLRPCGSAKARYVTADGRPVAGRRTSMDVRMVLGTGDSAFWGGLIEHSNIRKDWYTDAQGRITWRDLVPGVTYRINNRDVTVRPGAVRDLGDVVIDSEPVGRKGNKNVQR
ncbi:MAG TPA: sigma-70 family RNA polymerase sigma factor [Gemmataceae bacterium]|jgi:RNA polymerase sigma factor (sigma-70 family)|nr:sigma-70 family RNA polymerase sigma factor [Gemmataceae bacterium]